VEEGSVGKSVRLWSGQVVSVRQNLGWLGGGGGRWKIGGGWQKMPGARHDSGKICRTWALTKLFFSYIRAIFQVLRDVFPLPIVVLEPPHTT
jgi:hypothetical protein